MNESTQKLSQKAKKKPKSLTIRGFTSRARKNLEVQQGEYMRQYGKFIRRDDLAGLLLETAVLPKVEEVV